MEERRKRRKVWPSRASSGSEIKANLNSSATTEAGEMIETGGMTGEFKMQNRIAKRCEGNMWVRT
jgi:hypothetical protein